MPATTITLCADDYGLTAGIGRGIRTLVRQGRLSATSCMTTSPLWREEARRLRELDGLIDIGLHLTLTDQEPAGSAPLLAPEGRFLPLRRIMLLLQRQPEARHEAKEQFMRQLDAFAKGMGRLPDHIDGHQHIHLLPGARDAVIEAAASISRRQPIWVRSCVEPLPWILRRQVAAPKASYLSYLGLPLRKLAQQRGITINDSFRGVSDFRVGRAAPEFRSFLPGPGERPLIMCHPGEVDERLAKVETLVGRRAEELAWLLGEGFARDLSSARLRIARLTPPTTPTGNGSSAAQ